jgi:hypothetical protein
MVSSPAANRRQSHERKQTQINLTFGSPLAANTAYMHVIKEPYNSVLRRQNLERQKQKILGMDFGTGHKPGWQQLNQFLSERASERYSACDT